MPSQFLLETAPTPSEVVWAHTTLAVTGITRTHQMNLTSLAASAYIQGAKADLSANPASEYDVEVALKWISTPVVTAGGLVYVYFGFSGHATAGTLNPAGLSGADGAYVGYTSDDADDAQFHLPPPYLFRAVARGATVQRIRFATPLLTQARHVSPLVRNETSQALFGDGVDMYVRLVPHVIESQ
ncbi:MAG TPA: hypothetical protein VGA77_06635 [Propylenella sp.]